MRRTLAAALIAPLVASGQIPFDRIAAGASASAVLGAWCKDHRLGLLHAERLYERNTPSAFVMARLEAHPGDPIGYRKVRLVCGGRTVSVADNWYRSDRLTAEMNRRLKETEIPFGLVVQPLGFHRRTLRISEGPHGRMAIRAVLIDRTGAPFSYVVEEYADLSR